MNLRIVMVGIHIAGLVGVAAGAYTTIKLWSKHSELGRKAADHFKS